MRRFIRYLYEYQQNERVRNIGFVKVEQETARCTIHIHGKGLQLTGEPALELYIFYREGQQCTGIRQGTIENVNPALNYRLIYEEEDVGRAPSFEDIGGIILCGAGGKRFASSWNDEAVDVEHMREEVPVREEMPVTEAVEEPPNDEVQPGQENLAKPEELGKDSEPPKQEEPAKKESGQERRDAAVAVDTAAAEPADTGNPDVEAAEAGAEAYITPSTVRYEKITRQQMSRLPRREWRLANNSFLLHGYYNYHHLLFVEEDGKTWIGVPGIFHEKEQAVAKAFGFPHFQRISEKELELKENEKNTFDDFGYWCRQVEHL